MKAGNIISKAATLLGRLSLCSEIEDNLASGKRLSESAKTEVKKLLACYNLTLSELSEEYCPLKFKETLTPVNNKIFYTAFSKPPIEIKSVYKSVNALSFDVYPTYLEVNADEEVSVEYVYKYVDANDLNDDFLIGSEVVTERVIAEGITAEYLLILGLYEEALLWRDRYVKSLQQCLLKRRVNKIKPRGWY